MKERKKKHIFRGWSVLSVEKKITMTNMFLVLLVSLHFFMTPFPFMDAQSRHNNFHLNRLSVLLIFFADLHIDQNHNVHNWGLDLFELLILKLAHNN